MSARDRILLFAPNWLGDAVMALPAMAGVRRSLPAAAVDVAARPAVAALFALASPGSTVVTLGKGRAGLEALKQGRYDVAIFFPNSFNVVRLAWSAGIPERWGYEGNFRSLLLTRAAAPVFGSQQIDLYRRLVEAFGLTADAAPPTIDLGPEARQSGAALLRANGWNEPERLVAIAPGAAFGTAKRWPAVRYAALLDSLAADGIRAVIIGSAADRSAGDELVSAFHGDRAPINLIGRTDLAALGGVLVQCRALVTNDSGAMHFAAALGLPVTAVIGPTREKETSPSGLAPSTVITHPVWCRPCMLRDCPLTHRCMTGIQVETVLAATRALL